jgi:hypothetical protein
MIKDNGNYLLANNSDKLRKSMTIAKFMNNKTIQKAWKEKGSKLGTNLKTKDVNSAKVDITSIMTVNAANCQPIVCKLTVMENAWFVNQVINQIQRENA